jgi:hypothetical protein
MNFWISVFGIIAAALACFAIFSDTKIRHRYYWKEHGRRVLYFVDLKKKDYNSPENLEKCECHPLISSSYSLGRNPLVCDIPITKSDAKVSRLSCRLFFKNGAFHIKPINQQLITVFRGEDKAELHKGKSDALVLKTGDLIRIGDTFLLFDTDRR